MTERMLTVPSSAILEWLMAADRIIQDCAWHHPPTATIPTAAKKLHDGLLGVLSGATADAGTLTSASVAAAVDYVKENCAASPPDGPRLEAALAENEVLKAQIGMGMAVQLTGDDWETIQELTNAVGDLPGVFDRVEAFMLGRGVEDPRAALEALREKAF